MPVPRVITGRRMQRAIDSPFTPPPPPMQPRDRASTLSGALNRRRGGSARGPARGRETKLWHDFLNFHGHFLAFPSTQPAKLFLRQQVFNPRRASGRASGRTGGLACSGGFGSAADPTPASQPASPPPLRPGSLHPPSLPPHGAVAPCFHPLADSVCSSVCSRPPVLSVSLSLSLSLSLPPPCQPPPLPAPL